MTERPQLPKDLAKRMKRDYRALAEYYSHRARRALRNDDRERWLAAAQRYRQMEKVQQETPIG